MKLLHRIGNRRLAVGGLLLAVAAGLFGATAIGAPEAQRGRRLEAGEARHGGFGQRSLGRMARQLDLTEEQRDQFRQAMRESGDRLRDQRRAVSDARRAMTRAARDPEVADDELRALGEALGRSEAEAVVLRRQARARLQGILTEEQRERLRDIAPERRFERRHERRRGRRRF